MDVEVFLHFALVRTHPPPSHSRTTDWQREWKCLVERHASTTRWRPATHRLLPPAVATVRILAFSNDDHTRMLSGRWLLGWVRLTALDCTGLSRLVTVGDFWLDDCTSLTALDCTGLTQLVTVGSCWLDACTSLTALDCLQNLPRPVVVQLHQSSDAR